MVGKNAFDVIMVGGGVMGCATAYYLLKKDPQIKVAIVEKDPTYEFNSTVLSDANIRLQFNVKENILISQYGLEVLETFAEDMAVDNDKPDQERSDDPIFLVFCRCSPSQYWYKRCCMDPGLEFMHHTDCYFFNKIDRGSDKCRSLCEL